MGQGQGKHSAQPTARGVAPTPGRQTRPSVGTNAALVQNRPHAVSQPGTAAVPTPAQAPTMSEERMPVMLRYQVGPTKERRHPPKVNTIEVKIESEGWKSYSLTPSTDDFFTIVDLPRGTHAYKFIVDGTEVVDKRQPCRQATATTPEANIVTVAETVLRTREDGQAADDDGAGWGQEMVAFEETRKLPPILPPHLRYTPLNTPPTQQRCNAEGTLGGEAAGGYSLDPEHLPMPLPATINHVYFQRRNTHVVVGVTTRFRNKFTSVVLYKGEPAPVMPPDFQQAVTA